MARVLVLGAESMVGSALTRQPPFGEPVAAAGRSDPRVNGLKIFHFTSVDFSTPQRVEAVLKRAPEEVVVNFAARTEVDPVERERPPEGKPPSGGSAFLVNALSAAGVARAAQATGKYLIHISTDFVFDGESGPYAEDTPTSPYSSRLSWYGWTKSEGERLVREACPTAAILRISYPYGAHVGHKSDFARSLLDRRREGTLHPLYSDQVITPTWIDDLPGLITRLIGWRIAGNFHAASPTATTPLEFARELFREVDRDRGPLAESRLAERIRSPTVAPRPVHGGLRCDRVIALGYPLTDWQEGIRRLAAGLSRGVARSGPASERPPTPAA